MIRAEGLASNQNNAVAVAADAADDDTVDGLKSDDVLCVVPAAWTAFVRAYL